MTARRATSSGRRTMPKQKPGKSKQDYSTPEAFIDAVCARLGIMNFWFDFAADKTNYKASLYWDDKVDSLSKTPEEWLDHLTIGGKYPDAWGWLNPPFADITPWAFACAELRRVGGQVAFLVPAGVGSNWYRDFVHGHAQVWALNGRLSFMEDQSPYPKDCLLCLYAPSLRPSFGVWRWKDSQ